MPELKEEWTKQIKVSVLAEGEAKKFLNPRVKPRMERINESQAVLNLYAPIKGLTKIL